MLLALGLDPALRDALRAELNRHGEELHAEVEHEDDVLRTLATSTVELLVLGPRVEDPIGLAQRIRLLDRNAAILVLPRPAHAAKLEEAARIGVPVGREVVVVADLAHAPARVRQALLDERRRRATRAMIAATNNMLPAPPPTRARAAEYLDRVMTHAPVGILFVDKEGAIVSANPAARAILRDGSARTLQEHFRDPPLPDLPDEVPVVAMRRTPEGDQHVEITLASLRGRGDDAARLVILRDVTDRVRHEAELRTARAQLAQGEKLAALGSLVAGVAHEVRTPLAYIMNHAELLARLLERVAQEDGRPEDARQARELAAGIQEGVDRINRLVLDLRRFTRQDAAARVRAPLGPVVSDAVDLFEAASPRIFRIERALRPTPDVWMDPIRVQQVVINLLQNASEAMRGGGAIRIETRADGEDALLVVRDEGPGIPTDLVPKVFDPLFTTKAEGTGLGLAIVKRIVETHQGRLELDTGPRGTTFRIRFPGAQGSPEEGPSPNRSNVSRHSR